MASVIKAGNATDGIAVSSDNTGILELKTGTGSGTTAVTIGTDQSVTFAAGTTINGITVGRGGGSISTNTAVGASALNANTTGATNSAFGNGALQSNTTASNNTAVGYRAGYSQTTGGSNTAIGREALYTSTGSENTAVGDVALYANTTGSYNTALGRQALYSNTTASNNTAVGYQAGYNVNGSDYSVFVGSRAASSGAAVVTGDYHTCVGDAAGFALQGASTNNALFGQNCGSAITTGSKNTVIGSYTGNQGGLDIRTSSNQIVLSDGDGNPRVWVNSTGSARLGVNTTTSAAFVVGTSWIGNPVTVFGGDNDGSTISIGTSSTATYKIGNGNNRTGLTLISDFNTGGFAFAYIGFNGNSIIYQNGTVFVLGAPGANQIGLTFNNTGSVVTITTGSSKSALCKVAVISVAVDM